MFRLTVQPVTVKEDENSAAMVVYQAAMSNAIKQMLELMKGNAAEQTKGLERIEDKFSDRMQASLGADFQMPGNTLKAAGESQKVSAEYARELTEAAAALVEINRSVQADMAKMTERQERLAVELREQKEQLSKACDEMSDEISNQLYAFDQMRSLYEK